MPVMDAYCASTEFLPCTLISHSLNRNDVPYILSRDHVGNTSNTYIRKRDGATWQEVGTRGLSLIGRSLVFDLSNLPHLFLEVRLQNTTDQHWLPSQRHPPRHRANASA